MNKKVKHETQEMELETKQKKAERIFRGEVDITHDLFKLNVANTHKNVSISLSNPYYEAVPHIHFFHTHDSNGKRLTSCNSVGGHYHEVTVFEKDGEFHAECGPAITKKGKKLAPTTHMIGNKLDDHRHDISYVRSEIIKARKLNKDAQTVIAQSMSDVPRGSLAGAADVGR